MQMNRILLSVIAGTICGIIRIEGILNGVGMYVLCQFVGSILMSVFACPNGGPSEYFQSGVRDIILGENFSGIMTFILVWTLVYDIVHIF